MKQLKIRGKIFLMLSFLLLVLSVAIFTVSFYQVNKLCKINFDSQLDSNSKLILNLLDKTYVGDWRIEGDKLYKGQQVINNNSHFIDKVKEETGNELTVFLRDTRICTTIEEEGKRITGTKASAEVIDKVLSGGNEYKGGTKILNKPYEVKYVPIKDKENKVIGMFFIGVERSIINQKVVKMMTIIVVIILGVMLVSFLVAVKIIKNITHPLDAAVNYFGIISEGDLSKSVGEMYLDRYDEIGDLARAARKMQMSVKDMILNVKEASKNINIQSETLYTVSEEMTASSDSVSTSISDVAKGTEDQAHDLVSITSILSDFGESLNEVVQAIKDVDMLSKDINFMANESNGKMQNLIQSVVKISSSFKEFAEKIDGLGRDINQINEITTLINNISDQTNLLALNAAIEAARAGESGRGFAIVAEEIRNLAEQSKISSENINKLISGISNESNAIIKNTDTMSKELDGQVQIINENINSFKKIVGAVDGIIPRINSINNSTVSINEEKNSILEKIEKAASVSQETAATSEQIAASSQEMNASAEEVSSTAQFLTNMTKEVMEKVNNFNIG